MGEHELAEYISGSNPKGKALTANEVLELAASNPEMAKRLLEAENIATQGEPRSTVVAGLGKIAGQTQ